MDAPASQTRGNWGRRWPNLANMMICHFNEDFDLLYGSVAGALSAAARDGTVAHRRAILREWRDWNASNSATEDLRPALRTEFAVALRFATPAEARTFMDSLYQALLVAVRAETSSAP